MAEIQKRTETVTKNFYRMDLSQEEAEVLLTVLSGVSGPSTGYRAESEGIYKSLKAALGFRVSSESLAAAHWVGGGRFDDER